MKILLVHNYYKLAGGEDTVFRNEKAMLEKNGHKVFIYTRHNSEIDSLNLVQKCLLPLTTIFSLKTYIEVRKIIKDNNIDIVHVHNTLTMISPSVYYAAFSLKVPVVQTIHNFRMLCPAATFYRNGRICEDCPKKGLLCSIKGRCYRGSFVQTLVSACNLWVHRMLGTYKRINYICLTEFNKNKLLMLNENCRQVDSKRIIVSENCKSVDKEMIRLRKNKREIIDESKIYIKPNFIIENMAAAKRTQVSDYYIYAARLEALKGIKLVVKAFKENGKKIYILGTGDQEEIVKRYVKKHNANNIEFLGQKSQEELHEILSHAKALIIGSQWYEGLPVSILEAYSHGVPVIAGNIGNVAEVVKEEDTGCLYKYNSYKALNEAIERFENGDEEMYSDNAYYEYKTFYSEDKNYKLLMDIYESVLNN